ncbi:MAG: hypothetical protein MJE77_06405 [Proteobacteria bacterium]|nr:hypothetical protein [Pseudomonadota bacterium]
MHDIIDLETRGVPGVFVATVEFKNAAEKQSRALGSDPAAVYVEHPIQDRTDDEMATIAEQALDALLAGLVQSP